MTRTKPPKYSKIVKHQQHGAISGSKYCRKLAFQFALLGAPNELLAANLGVSVDTINHWIATDEEFAYALKNGKTIADSKVVNAFYKSAVGFEHPDTVILTNRVCTYDKEGKIIESHVEPLIVNVMKYYPPNPYAANKWLSIRARAFGWADVQNINITQDINIKHQIDLTDLTNDELLMLERIGMKQLTTRTAKQLKENVQGN